MKKTVGILIFDDTEVLDFAGPFEVFSVTSELNNYNLFDVYTVAKSKNPIRAVNGLSVNPTYSFKDCPKLDILIIAGVEGSNTIIKDQKILNWVKKTHLNTLFTLSICSGSRLLGILNLLDNKPYCTHHQIYDDMKKIAPTAIPKKELRFTQTDNKIYTSGGISAGIDLSFHIVKKICGEKIAIKTAEYMEYDLKNK